MTILQPNRKFNTTIYAIVASVLIILAGFWIIYLYNDLVNMRHAISDNANRFQELNVENAEFQNAISKLINAEKLEISAIDFNLKKDANPEYYLTQWPLVSHF